MHVQPSHVLEMESRPLATPGSGSGGGRSLEQHARPQQQAAGAAPGAGAQLEGAAELPDKFSRHLLIRVPGCALSTNLVAGQLVAYLR